MALWSRPQNHEKGVPNHQKPGSQLSKPGKNDEKWNNSTHTHPNRPFLTGNSTSRPGEGFGMGPGPQKRTKNFKKCKFWSHSRNAAHSFAMKSVMLKTGL